MTVSYRPIAWWIKLLAVLGLLLCIDSCINRSSQQMMVISKGAGATRRGVDDFTLDVNGVNGRESFLVSADAFHAIGPGDQIVVHRSLMSGRYRGVEKGGERFSDLNFWNILLFFIGVACFIPLCKAMLLAGLRRLFGRWLPGL